MNATEYVKSLKEANRTLQGENKFELDEFPMTNIKRASDLESLKRCNTTKLKNKFLQGKLTLQELILVLRYKLYKYVGLLTYKLANNTTTKSLLKKSAIKIFANSAIIDAEKNNNIIDILNQYDKVVKNLTKGKEITFSDTITVGDKIIKKRVETTAEYKAYLSEQFGGVIDSWKDTKGKVEDFILANEKIGRKKRSNWFNATCKLNGITKETDKWQKANKIYAENLGADPTNVQYTQLKQTIPCLEEAIKDKSNERKYAFYTFKLLNKTVNLDMRTMLRGTGQLRNLLSDLKYLTDVDKALSKVDTDFYINEETRNDLDKKIKELGQQNIGDISENAMAETNDIKTTIPRRLSLPPKPNPASITNRPRSMSDSVAFTGDVKKMATYQKVKYGGIKMKFYIANLAKLTDEKQLAEELDKLVNNYSNDEAKKAEYKKKLIKKIRLKQFVTNENDILKKCFKVINEYKKQGRGSTQLPVETLHFYQDYYSSKDFDDFVTALFKKYYVNEEHWQNKKGEIGLILDEHAFNIQNDVAPKKTQQYKLKEITITNKVTKQPANDAERKHFEATGTPSEIVTKRITIPTDYNVLKRDSMRSLTEMFKRGSEVLWPEANKKLEEWKKLLPTLAPVDFNELKNEIKRSICLDSVLRKQLISNWRNLFEGINAIKYKNVFKNIINFGRSFNINSTKGKMYDLLSFIWLITVDYDPRTREKTFNALMYKLNDKIRKARGINIGAHRTMARAIKPENVSAVASEQAEKVKNKLSEAEQERLDYLNSRPRFMLNKRELGELQELRNKLEAKETSAPPPHLPPEAINMPSNQATAGQKLPSGASAKTRRPLPKPPVRKPSGRPLPPTPNKQPLGSSSVSRQGRVNMQTPLNKQQGK